MNIEATNLKGAFRNISAFNQDRSNSNYGLRLSTEMKDGDFQTSLRCKEKLEDFNRRKNTHNRIFSRKHDSFIEDFKCYH